MEDDLDSDTSSVTLDVIAVEPFPVPGGEPHSSTVRFRCVSDTFVEYHLSIDAPN